MKSEVKDWALNELAENEMQQLIQLHGLVKARTIIENFVAENEFEKKVFTSMLNKIIELEKIQE